MGIPPKLSQMKALTVYEGEDAVINTIVTGKPIPRIEWYREGTLIPNNPDFEVRLHL